MQIELASRVTDDLLDALKRLTSQLKISSPRLTQDEVAGLLSSDAVSLLTARTNADASAPILGMLTLIVYRVPTGVRRGSRMSSWMSPHAGRESPSLSSNARWISPAQKARTGSHSRPTRGARRRISCIKRWDSSAGRRTCIFTSLSERSWSAKGRLCCLSTSNVRRHWSPSCNLSYSDENTPATSTSTTTSVADKRIQFVKCPVPG